MQNNSIQQKKATLEQAKAILNQEFVGLENIINTIIDSISSWYLFPQIHERPVIVNLWGLTGVGKSSLINRLSELIGYGKRYYRFDLGAGSDSSWDIRMKLQDIAHNQNGQAMILGFDEFQHAKTIDELQREISDTPNRIIWDVLDSGKFSMSKRSGPLSKLYTLKEDLKYAVQMGVIGEKGFVTEQKEKFIDLLELGWRVTNYRDEGKIYDLADLMIMEQDHCDSVYELWPERFNNGFEVRDVVMEFDIPETVKFIEQVIEAGLSPREVDCSKALIFIMGNLDEAYYMSNDFNPDINADEFYEQSLKINISQIKQALRRRFRSEQIARLGNLHIIYPSFSQHSYYKLIEQELSRIKAKHEGLLNVKLVFHPSVNDIVYKEGVYPTQGIRPLLTTANYLIAAQLVKIHYRQQEGLQFDEVELQEENACLLFTFKQAGNIVEVKKEKLELNLEKLRVNRKDDMQAITAVHESGHIVLSLALQHRLPEYAFSVTADADSGGFVYAKNETKYISKKQMIKRAATYFGGFMAEKIVFGEDNITTGAENDLYKATAFISEMVNRSGMGSVLGAINVKSVNTSEFIYEEQVNSGKEIQQLLQAAAELAEETLLREKTLLLKLSEYLAENRMMKKTQIREMLCEYAQGIELDKVLNETESQAYKHLLKEQLQKVQDEKPHPLALPAFCLNQSVLDNKLSD